MRKLVLLLLAGVLGGGCYLDEQLNSNSSGSSDDRSAGAAQEADAEGSETLTPEEEEALVDEALQEWDAIRWHTAQGPSAKGAQQVMTLDGEITSDARFVRFAWDRFPWRGNALGHFFVWDGARWVGGKFEWIRSGGQSVKELQNIRNGYNGLRAPSKGAAVAFAWTSADGKQRSNLVKDTWR